MYMNFVGDVESSCFGSVLEAMKKEFGESYPLEKEECAGHIQWGQLYLNIRKE